MGLVVMVEIQDLKVSLGLKILYIRYNILQGVPKNALSDCCWSYSALAQSPFAGTPCL